MAVTPIDPGFAFDQVEGAEPQIDGLGTLTIGDKCNAAETKFFKSKTVEFVASGADVQSSLVSVAKGMPPGVGFVDEGNGKVHLEGVVSNGIIPDYPVDIYDLSEPTVEATGGTPGTYKLGQQDNIYVKFDVTFESSHISKGAITFPMYVVKDWNNERQALLDLVEEKYGE